MARGRFGRRTEPPPSGPPLPDGPLLLISPHLDDVALACEALIGRDEPIEVLNVFTAAPDPPQQGWWDLKTGFASSAEAWPVRREEDRAAFAGTPHRVRSLDLLDMEYLRGDRDAADGAAIEAAVAEWTERAGGGTVAVPAGAGRRRGRVRARIERLVGERGGILHHADHDFARDSALRALARRTDTTPLLYEELPYLWGRGADREVAAVAASGSWRAVPITVAVDREAKASRIGAYATQVPHLCDDGRRLDDPDALPPVERYWLFSR